MDNKETTKNDNPAASKLARFTREYMSVVGIVILAIAFSVGSYAQNGAQYFMTYSNWTNILLQTSTVAIVGLSQSILLLTGNFDLSLGRLVCLTSCVGAILMKSFGWSPLAGVVAMFVIGLAAGAFNGFMTAYVGIPAFIATLGTQYISYGVAKLITQATPIPNMPASLAWWGRGYLGPIPWCVIIMVVLYGFSMFMALKTRIGRNIYAVGSSREAAFFSGINVKKYYFGAFVFAGLCSSLAGLMLMSRLNSVAVTNGQNYEFDAVIGSIIGGVSMSGGKGKVAGTMFGVLFLITLFNGFSQLGVDPFIQDVLKGCVLVIAITLDTLRNRKKA